MKYLTFLIFLFASQLNAQTFIDSVFTNQNYLQKSQKEIISEIKESIPFYILVSDPSALDSVHLFDIEAGPVSQVLDQVLSFNNLDYFTYRDYAVLIAPREEIASDFSVDFVKALEESISVDQNTEGEQQFVVGNIEEISATGATVLAGQIIDPENNENVIGATILIEETQQGAATDENGRYELAVSPGTYTLQIQSIGYQSKEIEVKVISSGSLDIQLNKSVILLDEVIVEAQSEDQNITSSQVGVNYIATKEIEKLPSFLGEVDIVKSLLLQPGVNSVGEGASGFNVRGGNADQNLILLDEGIIYNPTHVLGFFNAFNPDIVSSAALYKGNIPAEYGGRLSSVLDINVKDGDFEEWHLKGGLGIVSSRFTLEGPIQKEKTSFLVSGRSSYSDWILSAINVPEIRASSASFYDINLRFAHRFNDKNNISLSFYNTNDNFEYNKDFGFEYGSTIGQLTYRKTFGNNVLSTLSGVWSVYDSQQNEFSGIEASSFKIRNKYFKIKENMSYNADKLTLAFGVEGLFHEIDPGKRDPFGEISAIIPSELETEKGLEATAYIAADYEVSPRFLISAGARYIQYHFLGPQSQYLYANPGRPEFNEIIDEVQNDGSIYSENRFEPRLSLRYTIDAQKSIKAGYARTSQFLNQISNNETATPTSIWQLSNQYLSSNLAHNYTIGYFQNFKQNIWESSVELYYRDLDRIFDYKDFADLLVNDHLETELLSGIGRSYGAELSIKKKVGTFNGWLSYTYSRTERQIEGINNGEWYPSNYDKPHDLSFICNIQLNKRNTIAINFNYSTGRPVTIPGQRYLINGEIFTLDYSDRNAWRIPDYHRLDIAYTLGQGYRINRKYKTSWTVSLYNVYGRKNAFSVFLNQQGSNPPEVQKLSVLGSIFPSLTFNFEKI